MENENQNKDIKKINASNEEIETTKAMVDEIYNTHKESESFYKRSYCDELIYTEGVKDFQEKLGACWVVDLIISYIPTVFQTSLKEDDGFFVTTISVDEKNRAEFEIFREGYVNNRYDEHICVVRKSLGHTGLIHYDYKFYLIMTNTQPAQYTLLLPGEY